MDRNTHGNALPGHPALRTLRWILALSALSLALSSCARGDASDAALAQQDDTDERISVVGSSTIAPLMGELAKAHEKSHPGLRIDVQAGGSSRGVLDVRNDMAKLGMVSRALKPDESDLGHVLIARDGVGIIVNAENSIERLTRDQVIGIYTGRIGNWSELGGEDIDITVVSKAEGRSTLEIFSDYFAVPYKDIHADVIIGDNQQGIQTVAGARQAIGYVSIGSAEYETAHGAPIRLVPVDDQVPTTEAVASGNYAITRELNLVFKQPLSRNAQGLLDFARSPEAAPVVQSHYFVPTRE